MSEAKRDLWSLTPTKEQIEAELDEIDAVIIAPDEIRFALATAIATKRLEGAQAERKRCNEELENWKKRTWITETELVKRREDVLALAEKLGVSEDDFDTFEEIVAAAIRKG